MTDPDPVALARENLASAEAELTAALTTAESARKKFELDPSAGSHGAKEVAEQVVRNCQRAHDCAVEALASAERAELTRQLRELEARATAAKLFADTEAARARLVALFEHAGEVAAGIEKLVE